MSSETHRVTTELVVDASGTLRVLKEVGLALDRTEQSLKTTQTAANQSSAAQERQADLFAKAATAQERQARATVGGYDASKKSVEQLYRVFGAAEKAANPLVAVELKYQRAIAATNELVSRRAIGEDRAAATIKSLRQQQVIDLDRVRAATDNLSSSQRKAANSNRSGYSSNIGAQFQDIGVTAYGGMSPLTIALQQGTQLSAVFSDMRASGVSAGAGIAAAFGSILSPMSLVTIGLVAGVAALIQYFTSADEEGEKANAKLREQAAAIKGVVNEWGNALPALKAYNTELERQSAIRDLFQATESFAETKYTSVRLQMPDIRTEYTNIQTSLGAEADAAKRLYDTFTALTAAVDENKVSVGQIQAVIDAMSSSFLAGTAPVEEATRKLEAFKLVVDQANASVDPARMQRAAATFSAEISGWLDRIGALSAAMSALQTFQKYMKDFTDENERAGAAAPIPTPRPNDIEIWDAQTEAADKAREAALKAVDPWANLREKTGEAAAGFDYAAERARSASEDIASTMGEVLGSIFTDPLKDVDDFFDRIAQGFAGLGRANLQKTFDFIGGKIGLTSPTATTNPTRFPTVKIADANGAIVSFAATNNNVGPSGNSGNAFLNLIGKYEGTDRGAGYNESLAYGKFTGGPRNLVSMTIDQIDALQTSMLRHTENTYNSSALGRYQFVQTTLRELVGKNGISGSTLFSPQLQDELALQLARARGGSTGANLGSTWVGLNGAPDADLIAAFQAGVRDLPDAVKVGSTDGVKYGIRSANEDHWAGMRAASAGADAATGAPSGLDTLFGLAGAGLGGFSMGYGSQSPLMGAVGGALSGFGAGASLGAGLGPVGALVGGLAGIFVAALQSKRKDGKHDSNQRVPAQGQGGDDDRRDALHTGGRRDRIWAEGQGDADPKRGCGHDWATAGDRGHGDHNAMGVPDIRCRLAA